MKVSGRHSFANYPTGKVIRVIPEIPVPHDNWNLERFILNFVWAWRTHNIMYVLDIQNGSYKYIGKVSCDWGASGHHR